MIEIEILEAEGYHKFIVGVTRDGSLVWADFLIAEDAEREVKNIYERKKHKTEVRIIAEKSVKKKLGLLRIKEK